jgi:hypothetical protein
MHKQPDLTRGRLANVHPAQTGRAIAERPGQQGTAKAGADRLDQRLGIVDGKRGDGAEGVPSRATANT